MPICPLWAYLAKLLKKLDTLFLDKFRAGLNYQVSSYISWTKNPTPTSLGESLGAFCLSLKYMVDTSHMPYTIWWIQEQSRRYICDPPLFKELKCANSNNPLSWQQRAKITFVWEDHRKYPTFFIAHIWISSA